MVALTEAGWPTAVEKTTVLDKVGLDHHRKDDKFDACMLAEYADRFVDQLQFTTPPEEALDEIKQLYSERRRLVRADRDQTNAVYPAAPLSSVVARGLGAAGAIGGAHRQA